MRVLPALFTAVLALPLSADVSPTRRAVDYRRLAEVGTVPMPRLWYFIPGTNCAAVQDRASASIIDLSTGKERGRMDAGGAGFHDTGFSADGRMMVTARNDETVVVWDLKTVKEVRSFKPFGSFS